MAEAGLLDGHADLKAISLALRGETGSLRRAAALAALADDSRAISSLSAVYATREHSSYTLHPKTWPLTLQAQSVPPPRSHAVVAQPQSHASSPSVSSTHREATAEQHATPGAARAARDIGRGDIFLVVPHLRVPWATDLATVLWRTLGVRIERRGPIPIPSSDFGGILIALGDVVPESNTGQSVMSNSETFGRGAYNSDRFNDVAKQFYPPLSPDDHEYNMVVSAHLQRVRGPHAVAKLANLVRLSYVNSILADIRCQIVKVSTELSTLGGPDHEVHGERGISSRFDTAPTGSLDERTVVGYGCQRKLSTAARRPRGSIRIAALPVKGDHNASSTEPAKYLLHGSIVPANLLGFICDVLARDFHIHVALTSDSTLRSSASQRLPLPSVRPKCLTPFLDFRNRRYERRAVLSSCRPQAQRVFPDPKFDQRHPRADATGTDSENFLDIYLSDCFGLRWSALCAHVLHVAEIEERNAKRESLETNLCSSCLVEDHAQHLRTQLINNAVSFQIADAPLSQKCAIRLAQTLTAPEVNGLYNSMPREVWRLIASAKSQLEELENAEYLSLQSLNAP